jgi:hypothetical protein
VNEVVPGLLRWTAPHPAWRAGAAPESPDDWPEEVGCVLHLTEPAAVFIDPLVTDDLWPALDERVAGRPVVVLTTLRFHRRSRDAVLERYDGTRVRPDGTMPAGVEAVPIEGFDETMYWLAEPRALVPGDRLIGDGAGGVRPCPVSWLQYLPDDDPEHLRRALLPLLELPAEHVLVSHGEPVVGTGREAIARALGAG